MAMQQHQPAKGALSWVGSFDSGARANEILAAAGKQFHLVSPASSVGSLPEGCEVATSFVQIDTANESYDVGMGKRGLAKVALDRIASAAGISWDPIASCRLDDGSDPYYVSFRAVGTMRGFDGTPVTIVGTKEMDLRPGSPQLESLESKARAKGKSSEAQVREMRLHIMGHAESKARLRAIRSIGLRTSYTPDELNKPFLIARLVFTGRTDDPELGRAFAMVRANAMLGGMAAMYGAPAAQLPAAQPQRMTVGVRPPPVGQVRDLDEEDVPPPRPSPTRAAPPPPPAAPAAAPPSGGNGGGRRDSGSGTSAVWPWDAKREGDPGKGDSLSTVADDALDRLVAYCDKKAAEGGRWAERDATLAAAARAEIAFRNGEVVGDPTGGYGERDDL